MRQSDNSEATVRLRPMRERDVAFLTNLWVASWGDAMPEIDFAERRAWIEAVLRAPDHVTLVAATTAGRPSGFATWEVVAPAMIYLHQLAVAPRAKGTGVAGRLLSAVKARAPGTLALDVNQANARAVRFYEREGLAIVGSGRNPTSGLATWHMTRTEAPAGAVRLSALRKM